MFSATRIPIFKFTTLIIFTLLFFIIAGCSSSTSPSSAKAITAYSINSIAGTIDETGKTISVTLPFDTNVTALVATFTTTGNSVNVGTTLQASGTTANNFTNPVVYTVTAADNTTAIYTVTVIVAAPAGELPKTGQTTSYDTGGIDDGALQRGVAWPGPRFTDNGDQTVTDNLTGLMWTKDGSTPTVGTSLVCTGGAITWQAGLDYVSCLNTNIYMGHNDWRLPNRNELRSLANFSQASNATWLNTQGLSNARADWCWSSSTYAVDTGFAWIVYMDDGHVNGGNKPDSHYVWPVRDGISGTINVPQSGQTICYNVVGTAIACAGTGQDGDLLKGVAWSSPRFTDNGDQTVTDNLTGLMWTKDGNAPGTTTCSPGVTKTWQVGLDYVTCLNTNSYLGHTDWRLPNINELESLVHAGQANAATWLNTQGFSNVQADWYLSSSTYAVDTGVAWIIGMGDGIVEGGGKAGNFYVWPVRAGQ